MGVFDGCHRRDDSIDSIRTFNDGLEVSIRTSSVDIRRLGTRIR